MGAIEFTNALQLAVYVSAPVIAAVLLAGLLSGVLQTITQISDEAISFASRIAAAALAFLLFGNFVFAELQGFANYSWNIQQSSGSR